MIKFKETGKRQYDIMSIEGKTEEKLVSLDLMFSPAINKYDKIYTVIEDCSEKLGKEFDDWFKKYITDFVESGFDYIVIKNNIPKIREFTEKYIDVLGIDFDDYINRDKISKSSIFFDEEEIKKIVLVSNYLKFYFTISHDNKMRLPTRFHKEIFKELVSPISDCDILFKLFKIVSSKIYKYHVTDAYMWEYIKMILCKTTDIYIVSTFNFIVNNILVVCEPESNPIPFLISVIDESIQWMLRGVYKDAVIYSDAINTEDVYSMQGKDNLKTYAYNDSIGRLVLNTYNALQGENISDVDFNEAVKSKSEASLFSTYITYPILCKVLEIPYRHFITIPVEHGHLLNILLHQILPKEFKEKYPVIYKMLIHYNRERAIVKTTYKVKNMSHFTDSLGTFLGFKNMNFVYHFYSEIVGKLARNTYVNFKTGKEITNFPLAKLEENIISFYNDYFDGRLDPMFEEIKEKVEEIL